MRMDSLAGLAVIVALSGCIEGRESSVLHHEFLGESTLQTGGPSLCSRSSGKPLAPRGCPDRYPPHSRFAGKNTVSLKHGNVLSPETPSVAVITL